MHYSEQFNKPPAHVMIDLVNRTLYRQFGYSQASVAPIQTGFSGHTCLVLPALWPRYACRERASMEVTVEGYANTLKCNYHKLLLSEYLPHPTFVGDGSLTETQILAQLRSKYKILLDEETTTVVVFGNKIDNDTAWRGAILPHADHLVWAGPVEILIAGATHIAHELIERHLPTIDFTADADIAQELLAFDLDESA